MNRLIFGIAIFIIMWIGVCSAKTIHVPDDASTIQAGINAAVEGDTVLVADGVYSGDGNRDMDFGGRKIVLKSLQGPLVTIIDCDADSADPHRGFLFENQEDSTSIIEGFTIQRAYEWLGAGIHCSHESSPCIIDCIFKDNVAPYGAGIFCAQYCSVDLYNCRFVGNLGSAATYWTHTTPVLSHCVFHSNVSTEDFMEWPVGVFFCYGWCEPFLVNCTFYNNEGHNVSAAYESTSRLENCIIAFGTARDAVYGPAEISCTDIFGNAGGDWTGEISSYRYINGNLCRDPLFRNPAHGDFSIADQSVCAPENNACGVLIGADSVGWIRYPRIWLVKANGTGDTPTIQAAIDSSISGDTVLVADGIFAGPGNRDLTLDGRSIVVKSIRGPESTVIFAGGRPGDFHRGFEIHNNEDSTTIIEGFTIRRGYASTGGGLYCEKSSPKIVNCIFRENGADYGGGISTGCGASPIFVDCDIVDNTAAHLGGGMHNFCGGNPRLIACTFHANFAGTWGGAACSWGVSPTMSGCLVTDNQAPFGGGFYCGEGSAPLIDHCIFAGNFASVAGGGMTLANEQTADTTVIANCTFSGNYAPEIAGGGISVVGTTPVRVENCIIAFSPSGAGISCTEEEEALSIACTNIFGNSGGDWTGCAMAWSDLNGNISLDPVFINEGIGDYSLGAHSPCLPENNGCGIIFGARGVCDCSGIGDNNADRAITPIDIVYLIDYILRNGPTPPEIPTCPITNRADFNCDGQTNLLDLVALINFVYRSPAPGPCNPCAG